MGILPGPVTDLHANKVTNGSVTLVWQPPQENVTVDAYQIQYQSVDKHSASKVIFNLNNVSITKPLAYTGGGIAVSVTYFQERSGNSKGL